jgi:hypothetical protein
MPVTHEIRGAVVVIELIGDYSRQDIVTELVRAAAEPLFREGSAVLIDTRSSLTYLSAGEIEARIEIFASLHRLGYGNRIAAVVPEDQRHRVEALSHFVASLVARGRDARLFMERVSAEEWLSLSRA